MQPGAGAVGEVVDAVERHAARDRRVRALEAGLVLGVVGGEGHEGRQVAARRAARDHEEVGVGSVLRAVLADPLHGALAVDQVVGKGGARAQAIVRADAHPAARRQVAHERDALLVLAAEDPGAAVDLEQRRAAGGRGTRAVDVELQGHAARPGVGDVAHPLDVAMPDRERHEDLPPVEGRGELLPDRGQDLLAVRRAKALAERVLDHGLGPARHLIAAGEPGPRPERDGQAEHAGPGGEGARPHERGRQQRLPGEVVECELGGQPAREEAHDRAPGRGANRPEGVVREPGAHDTPAAEEPGHGRRRKHGFLPCHFRARG